MTITMTHRERFARTMRYESTDYRPLHLVGPWPDTVARWRREGLPEGVDIHAYLGVSPLPMKNISPRTGLFPGVETRVLEETDTVIIFIDSVGRTVRDFKDHTSMPEWIDFPVKTREDLQQVIDTQFRYEDLEARFPADWEEQARAAMATDTLVLIDGGCYYWSIRTLAGVENASYLFYDAPDLVDELFERYFTFTMEALRRAVKIGPIDLIGFGEDIAYKTGTLISPAMFRQYILPRYKKVMDFAHAHGIEMTWYDSDGDVRPFIPDYLSVGINTVAPCEVAANMTPVDLRKQFGRDLRMIGGIDKREIARGRTAIDAEIARNQPLIDEGGFLPAIDHSISSDISFADYCYFVEAIKKALGCP